MNMQATAEIVTRRKYIPAIVRTVFIIRYFCSFLLKNIRDIKAMKIFARKKVRSKLFSTAIPV